MNGAQIRGEGEQRARALPEPRRSR
jgi:hypothetical protein